MPAIAAGEFRRTPIERSDQRVSWERTDHAFFAAGACHILAWACRDAYPDKAMKLRAMFTAGEEHPVHVFTTCGEWAFDCCGWNPETELLKVNAEFEGRAVVGIEITDSLAEFCERHIHRMPHQYWRDPLPRARDYIDRFTPPWRHASSR
jgi:hypothetical protein